MEEQVPEVWEAIWWDVEGLGRKIKICYKLEQIVTRRAERID